MIINIPKYTWIKIVDDKGNLLRQECTQKDLLLYTHGDKQGFLDCENEPTFGTMRPAQEKRGPNTVG